MNSYLSQHGYTNINPETGKLFEAVKIGVNKSGEVIYSGDTYEQPGVSWNCVTSSIFPLAYISSNSNVTLNNLKYVLSPADVRLELENDYAMGHGLVAGGDSTLAFKRGLYEKKIKILYNDYFYYSYFCDDWLLFVL